MSSDPVSDLIHLDAARDGRWRRVRDVLSAERDRRLHNLVRADASNDERIALAGEVRGLDVVLKALDKEFS